MQAKWYGLGNLICEVPCGATVLRGAYRSSQLLVTTSCADNQVPTEILFVGLPLPVLPQLPSFGPTTD